jgi:hypothetical protein
MIAHHILHDDMKASTTTGTNTTATKNTTTKRLVLLVGWLGCKPKSLKRYNELYKNLGCDVKIRIPSPTLIVQAASSSVDTLSYCHDTELVQGLVMEQRRKNETNHPKTMFELAQCTIDDICHKSDEYSEIYIHLFSNGGCFLWEAMNVILNNYTSDTCRQYYQRRLLISKLKGVIYDSAPCDISGKDLIYKALQFCTPSEQIAFRLQFIYRRLWNGVDQEWKHSQRRAVQFWVRMRNSPLMHAKSLYICSKTDTLTPFIKLEELIQHRRHIYGSNHVHNLIYDESPHCSHLRSNPNLYQNAIKDFVQCCTNEQEFRMNITPRSRL